VLKFLPCSNPSNPFRPRATRNGSPTNCMRLHMSSNRPNNIMRQRCTFSLTLGLISADSAARVLNIVQTRRVWRRRCPPSSDEFVPRRLGGQLDGRIYVLPLRIDVVVEEVEVERSLYYAWASRGVTLRDSNGTASASRPRYYTANPHVST